jgi:SAM-dependent methyltransferase
MAVSDDEPRDDPSRHMSVDASMLCVPIETPEGGVVTELRSASAWQAATGAPDAPPITVGDLLDERHHGLYRQPWIAGRFRFEFLRAHGLSAQHRVLDLGCGAGRVGLHEVAHLDAGCYHGIDAHLRALVAFSAYELRLTGLLDKRPRLMLDHELRFDRFGTQFDACLDVSSSRHLDRERQRTAYAALASVLRPGGRVFAARFRPERVEDILALGYTLESRTEVTYPFGLALGRRTYSDDWHVFGRPAT